MTFDDMKAMLKDVAEILKEKNDAGAAAVWLWLDSAAEAARGETLAYIASSEARRWLARVGRRCPGAPGAPALGRARSHRRPRGRRPILTMQPINIKDQIPNEVFKS